MKKKTLKSEILPIKKDLKVYLARVKRQLDTNKWTDYRNRLIDDIESKQVDNKGLRKLINKSKDNLYIKYTSDKKLIDSLIKKNKIFLQQYEEYRNNPLVREVHGMYRSVIGLHYKRLSNYLKLSNSESIKLGINEEDDFLEIDSELQIDHSVLGSLLNKLDIGEEDPTAHIEFRGKRVCPLIMHPYIIKRYPEVKEKIDRMGIDFESLPENKMLIQYGEEEIPFWDPTQHYWNQSAEALQFYVDEFKKIKNGIMIGDEYIHPWLYVHLNVYKTSMPVEVTNPVTGEKEQITITQNPPLRDNEWWLIQDNYRKASKKGVNKVMVVAATRRAGKTTMLISKYATSIYQGKKQNVLAGASKKDLGQVTRGFLAMCSEVHPAFDIPLEGKVNVEDEIQIVIKTKDQKNIGDQFFAIVNTEDGAEKSSEKLAGYSMEEFNWDEFMKASFLKILKGGEPAYKSVYGYRCTPLLTGCVCAGTKVWNNKGDLVNIEDLKQEEGIIGYDIQNDKISQEPITWMKPPAKKDCYRITTYNNRQLECSDDHPILKKSNEFVRTDSLKKGDFIMTIKDDFSTVVPEEIKSVVYIGKKDVYNLTAGNTHTYIANGIITHNTGGSDEMSSDALKMLNNMEANDVYPMDWDLFESRIPKDEIRWVRREFGTFIPAHMTAETGLEKDTTTLDKYLGKSDQKLAKIEIQVTDWHKANKHFDKELKKLEGDSDSLRRYKVYYPRDPGDIFLSGESNPYPADIIRQLRLDAEKNLKGEKCFLSIGKDGKIVKAPSEKPYIKFPFGGGNYNAPGTIWEPPVPNPPLDFYTAGLDDVQQETSGTDSVRAFVIWRRDTRKIVYSLYTRPSQKELAYQQMHAALMMYNCQVYAENVNMDLKGYFDALGNDVADLYLAKAINFMGDVEVQGSKTRPYGYAPTDFNKRHFHGIAFRKLMEKIENITEEGNQVFTYVYANQDDPRILNELEMYSPNRNLDGYDALRGALALDFYLTYNNIFPHLKTDEQRKQEMLERAYRNQYRKARPNVGNLSVRSSQFSSRKTKRNSRSII